jgi:hypothetical protein
MNVEEEYSKDDVETVELNNYIVYIAKVSIITMSFDLIFNILFDLRDSRTQEICSVFTEFVKDLETDISDEQFCKYYNYISRFIDTIEGISLVDFVSSSDIALLGLQLCSLRDNKIKYLFDRAQGGKNQLRNNVFSQDDKRHRESDDDDNNDLQIKKMRI